MTEYIEYKSNTQAPVIEKYCREGKKVIVHNLKNRLFNEIDKQYHSQIFSDVEVSYHPTENIKVPLHRKATDNEIEMLKNKKLPIILTTDIICRSLGFKAGDIIAIERKDEIYYRTVF
jgi:DNA-directed RNA polymerase subunit H (RpoH/RPB5)